MRNFLEFLSYHNAVPLAFSVLLLGAGAAFAATPDGREALVSAETEVVSIDNSYLVNLNLDAYTPRTVVDAVTEDSDAYYVSYTLSTIGVEDGAWQDTTEARTMTVAKGALGEQNLGTYVSEQLRQVIDHQNRYLREAQVIESRARSQKIVATRYTGLIGQFLDESREAFPGYERAEPAPAPAPSSSQDTTTQAAAVAASMPPLNPQVNPDGSPDTTPPSVHVLGNNPTEIPLGSAYVDLGVAVTDNLSLNNVTAYLLDGVEVQTVTIDTAVAATRTVEYVVRDQSGNIARATRTVIVGDPMLIPQEPSATSTAPEIPEPTAQSEPLPSASSTTPQ